MGTVRGRNSLSLRTREPPGRFARAWGRAVEDGLARNGPTDLFSRICIVFDCPMVFTQPLALEETDGNTGCEHKRFFQRKLQGSSMISYRPNKKHEGNEKKSDLTEHQTRHRSVIFPVCWGGATGLEAQQDLFFTQPYLSRHIGR